MNTLFWSQDVLPEAFSCSLHEEAHSGEWRFVFSIKALLEGGRLRMEARLSHFTAQTWGLSAAVGKLPFFCSKCHVCGSMPGSGCLEETCEVST
jgi:hypothetical protein